MAQSTRDEGMTPYDAQMTYQYTYDVIQDGADTQV